MGLIALVGWFGKCPMQKARPVFKIIALKPKAWGGGPCGHLRLQMSGALCGHLRSYVVEKHVVFVLTES